MVEESVNADDFFVQLKDQICPALKIMAKKGWYRRDYYFF